MGKNSFWVLHTERDKMKILITYKVGQSIREVKILASSLEHAEVIANKKFKNWIDLKIVNPKLEEK